MVQQTLSTHGNTEVLSKTSTKAGNIYKSLISCVMSYENNALHEPLLTRLGSPLPMHPVKDGQEF